MDLKLFLADCISKSAFLGNYPTEQLLSQFYGYMDVNKIDEDMSKEEVFTSGFYTSYNVCANIEDLSKTPDKYFIPPGVEVQLPMEDGVYDKYQVFDAPNHSSGVQAVIIAEHVQDMCDELDRRGYTDVSDITVDAVKEVAGNLFAVDLVPVPTKSFYYEKDLDNVTKIIRDDVLSTLGVTAGSKVAVIGGDKSSSSGRKRPYRLDSFYYKDKKMYNLGATLRRKRGISGHDYHSENVNELLEQIKLDNYDCFTFNYCDYVEDLEIVFEYFKNQGVPGYGIYIDPDYNDENICTQQEFSNDIMSYKIDTNKMDKYGVQVLTAPVEGFVHFCTTHGFVLEKMLSDTKYYQGIKFSEYVYNRSKNGYAKLRKYVGFRSLEHFKIYMTDESINVIGRMYLISDIGIYEDYNTEIKTTIVKNKIITIDGKDLPVRLSIDDGVVLSYVVQKEEIKFVDVDIPFNFYARVLYLEKRGLNTVYGLNIFRDRNEQPLIDTYSKYIFPYTHRFEDEPYKCGLSFIKILKLRNMDLCVKPKELVDSVVCDLKGVGYNPKLKKLCYNDLGKSYIIADANRNFKKLTRVTFLDSEGTGNYKMYYSDVGEFCIFGSNLVFEGTIVKQLHEKMAEFGIADDNEDKREFVFGTMQDIEGFDQILNDLNAMGFIT